MTTPDRLARWEQRTGWPLTAAAVVFLVIYAVPILEPDLDATARAWLARAGAAIWVMFVADYLVRLMIASRRARFFRQHLFDLVVVLLPMLRPLRALRVLTILGFLNRQTTGAFRGRVIAYVIAATGLVVFIAALAQLDAERQNPQANIQDFGDASWWAMSTITTVGYGDQYPTTSGGRLVGVGLMLSGIALLGVVTASFASWLLERLETMTATERRSEITLEHLMIELQALRAEIRSQAERSSPRAESEPSGG